MQVIVVRREFTYVYRNHSDRKQLWLHKTNLVYYIHTYEPCARTGNNSCAWFGDPSFFILSPQCGLSNHACASEFMSVCVQVRVCLFHLPQQIGLHYYSYHPIKIKPWNTSECVASVFHFRQPICEQDHFDCTHMHHGFRVGAAHPGSFIAVGSRYSFYSRLFTTGQYWILPTI